MVDLYVPFQYYEYRRTSSISAVSSSILDDDDGIEYYTSVQNIPEKPMTKKSPTARSRAFGGSPRLVGYKEKDNDKQYIVVHCTRHQHRGAYTRRAKGTNPEIRSLFIVFDLVLLPTRGAADTASASAAWARSTRTSGSPVLILITISQLGSVNEDHVGTHLS